MIMKILKCFLTAIVAVMGLTGVGWAQSQANLEIQIFAGVTMAEKFASLALKYTF